MASTDPTPSANATVVAVNSARSSNRRDRDGTVPRPRPRAGQRGEHRLHPHPIEEPVQQHRPRVAAVHRRLSQPRRPHRRPGRDAVVLGDDRLGDDRSRARGRGQVAVHLVMDPSGP